MGTLSTQIAALRSMALDHMLWTRLLGSKRRVHPDMKAKAARTSDEVMPAAKREENWSKYSGGELEGLLAGLFIRLLRILGFVALCK